jgi:SsrA-binding protein
MPDVTTTPARQSIAKNRRASHDYTLLETWEAGIALTGTEVKSLRGGKANISDAYGIVRDGEVYLLNLHKEIRKMIGAVERQGLTLVPLELYFKGGRAKVALALGKGKKLHDKREDARKADDARDMARAMTRRS